MKKYIEINESINWYYNQFNTEIFFIIIIICRYQGRISKLKSIKITPIPFQYLCCPKQHLFHPKQKMVQADSYKEKKENQIKRHVNIQKSHKKINAVIFFKIFN